MISRQYHISLTINPLKGNRPGWTEPVLAQTSFPDPATKRTSKTLNQHGFTMIEMILVLIVMAIVGTFVASRASMGSNDLITEVEILKSHLRYAQIRAMSDTVPWGIYIPGTGSYVLYKNNAQATSQLPGETGQTHSLPSTVTVSTGTINFDDLGSPGPTTRNLTLTQGTETNTITITKNTGYIP